ncbi:hypothetical protein CVT26_007277 [Gymnopilus dilepis]|uniref:VWFA domain-containing protein n=1 Tax=Gymnopilus dilepis TaxID=231916 RepID=A0A409W1D6_9AGAR|nr:hypothetical protein CVT26_007277 [Gymnopilus dilepis]
MMVEPQVECVDSGCNANEDLSLITPLPSSPPGSPSLGPVIPASGHEDRPHIEAMSQNLLESPGFVDPEADVENKRPISSKVSNNDAETRRDPDDTDSLGSLNDVFRLLELVTEQGSGGLVDKIVIAEDSLKAFINRLSPNAYTSLTKVNFKALDLLNVHPIGVYGPKSSLASFLLDLGILDELDSILAEEDAGTRAQSGLYAVLPSGKQDFDTVQIYIVYWPEKFTWHDDATSAVRRNRITFMRYLNKIADQILCLVPPDILKTIVWTDEEEEETDMDIEIEDDCHDRLFSFEVSKTTEQAESVSVRDGFQITFSKNISQNESVPQDKVVKPILLKGETAQGFLVPELVEPSDISSRIHGESFNVMRLREFLSIGTIKLASDFTHQSLEILVRHGIQRRFPALCAKWEKSKSDIDNELEAKKISLRKQSDQELKNNHKQLEGLVFETFLDFCRTLYPENLLRILEKSAVFQRSTAEDSKPMHLDALYPQIKPELNKMLKNKHLEKLSSPEYRKLKKQLVAVQLYLEQSKDKDEEERQETAQKLITSEVPPQEPSGILGFLTKLVGRDDAGQQINNRFHQLADRAFLAQIDDPTAFGGEVANELITKTLQLASEDLQNMMNKNVTKMTEIAAEIQRQTCYSQIDVSVTNEQQDKYRDLRLAFTEDLMSQSSAASDNKRSILLAKLEVNSYGSYSSVSWQNSGHASNFRVFATEINRMDPYLDYKINVFELTSEDRQNLQLDPTCIPTPAVNERLSFSFNLPPEYGILHAQLLPESKLLLLVDDRKDTILVFCDTLSQIGNAVKGRRSRKQIRREKTGQDVLIAFDEGKRMLAICAASKFLLYIFVFDEAFAMLQSWANAVNLKPWYDVNQQICHACFVTGNEEILLVDNQAQGRIFSLNTQQCRPASLDLQQIPWAVLSSPDGACFLAIFNIASGSIVRAFHWATFGSTEGIDVAIDLHGSYPLNLTSFVSRNNVHLLIFDPEAASCRSVAFNITKKSTEFMFKEKSSFYHKQKDNAPKVHNCLLDCHSDMWTRFPVFPAIQRQTKIHAVQRPKLLLFISDDDRSPVSSYFSRMMRDFEQKTRKPTGEELRAVAVSSMARESYGTLILEDLDNKISRFRAGEWLVDLLCLIPIHIAITRDNRFIPLKDGISSATYEKSLLGAEMSAVVDSISFGWYEPILQSYMSTKPVKVVSSMGEQSVGKSYALNHMLDTSFAGSAMRTTEGVWMSVTPTDEALIVALDFEGVHSIERSAQEDTLLVLFNTAISNLVLFRNNFALSRDITGLFQSFQSSASVFDPAANPGLFRSTLAIIIKDVVDSDKKEIVKEFSLKFQKIVQDEQESNFISRLHAGQLKIVPWPVIESKQFYSLFPALKKVLDIQPANDWRALSQSMISHRVHQLLSMLPNALAFGYGELEPHPEDLKDFDTDTVISFMDTPAKFFLSTLDSEVDDRDGHLLELCQSWPGYQSRQAGNDDIWIEELSTYISDLLNRRIEHVNLWVSKNLANFQTGSQASIATLNRSLAAAIIDIRTNVEICKQQCSSCQLHCTLSRRHGNKPHDCNSSHKCIRDCEFTEEHPASPKLCGYPAGHGGKHVCIVEDHLCGEPCTLKDKAGCLGECTQVRMTCAQGKQRTHDQVILLTRLRGIKLAIIDALLVYTIVERESHSCHAYCSPTNGICEIDTMPQSIEATFTGQHSTFQYTKYSQGITDIFIEKKRTPHVTEKLPNASSVPLSFHLWHSVMQVDTVTPPRPIHFISAKLAVTSVVTIARFREDIPNKSTKLAMDPCPDRALIFPLTLVLRADPYSRDDRANFAKCDAMCPGPEHSGTSTNPAQPSYCTLPMFHPPHTGNQGVGLGYVSHDGHMFSCKNPALMQQAFHVIFVIDRSGSMGSTDQRPLRGTPVSDVIARHSNNRLGAVYSSLYAFWRSRVAAVSTGQNPGAAQLRRDAYSVVLFDHTMVKCIENDFSNTPEQLVNALLGYRASGGTDYASAIKTAEDVMRRHWSTERVPVIIFLSDGECSLDDVNMRTLCRAAIALGKPLSFHGVSFGPKNQILRRMAQIAREIQTSVPPDPLQPAAAMVESSFAEALDSVRLAETFLGIAESLKKPRAALVA